MEYDDTFGRRKDIRNDPSLAEFRRRVANKSNGGILLDSYIKAKSDFDFRENSLKAFSPEYPYYQSLQDDLEKKRKALAEAENMLGEEPGILEKFLNAPKLALDPLEKGIDVLKNFLSPPEPDLREKSQKPSLWEIFFK